MTVNAAKLKMDDPAASPSRPSVRLTALLKPTITTTAKITQPTLPRSIPNEL